MLRFSYVLVAMLSCLAAGPEWLAAGPAFAQTQNPPPTQNSKRTTVTYAVRFCSPKQVVDAATPILKPSGEAEVSIDRSGKRVVLSGPDWAHQLVESIIDRMDRPGTTERESQVPRVSPSQPARQTSDVSLGRPLESQPSIRRLIQLPTGTSARIQRDLRSLFAGRLHPVAGSQDSWHLKTHQNQTLAIQLDLAREDALLEGPESVTEEFMRLLQALGHKQQTGLGQTSLSTQVVTANHSARQQLIAILGSTKQIAATANHLNENSFAPIQSPAITVEGMSLRGPFRIAALQDPNTIDPALSGQVPGPREEQPNSPQNQQASPTLSLPQFEDVEIQQLPELDAIILRGRDGDLEQLSEIIRQLEKLSRETQPAVRVVPLRFTNSIELADVVTQTQPDLTGTRQGKAQILALAKPNALLLYGWGEAVKALEDLISKLDRPVSPESQFRVFVLRHARATSVQQTINSFFASRTGALAPQIESTIDARTNTLVVHAAPRDMAEVERLIQQLDTPSSGMVKQTRIFEIRNSLAADVADTLEDALANPTAAGGAVMELLTDEQTGKSVVSGVLENLQITVNARNNSLIISAPPNNFELIQALIDQIDTARATAKIKIFPIKNSDAASLIETLRSLLPSQAGEPTPASDQLPSGVGETALVPLRFTVDVRSNSVIASGNEGDLMIVEALVTRLDEADAMQRKNSVYHLKNAPAVDVALAINEFLRSRRQVELAAPGAVNPFQQLEKEVVVVPEPVSNKLVLSATPRYFDEISDLIEKLDEQPPQVMIQVLIAEVTLDNAEEFGIELGLQDSVLFDRGLLGDLVTLTETNQISTPAGILTETNQNIVGASNDPGFNFNNTLPLGNSGSNRALNSANSVGGQGLSNFDVGRGNAELGFGGLVLSASSQNVSVLLRALEESRRLQVLSRPQVLTLDNQPAFIQVGQRVPRIVGSSINQIGQQNEIALENVGLILGVTPRISPEGNVVMEIDAEKSSIGPDSEGIPVSVSADGTVIRSPRVDVTSAQATVSAADGETIILGGLITTSDREVHRKVPFLGDIPILKHLFRFDSIQSRRAELIIVLTPRVVRSPGDMEMLKQVELARMSWCAADVFDLHPDAFAESVAHASFEEEGDWDVVYPHTDPRGQRLQSLGQPVIVDGQPPIQPPNGPMQDLRSVEPLRMQAPEMLPPPSPSSSVIPGTSLERTGVSR